MAYRGRGPRFVPPPEETHRINRKIRTPQVRLIGAEGEQVGIVPIEEALATGRAGAARPGRDRPEGAAAGLPHPRLRQVQVSAAQERIRGEEEGDRTTTVKELRLGYRTDTGDIERQIAKAREFLEEGDRVKFLLRFRGREMAYQNLGREKLMGVCDALRTSPIAEGKPRMEGRMMGILLAPRARSAARRSRQAGPPKEAASEAAPSPASCTRRQGGGRSRGLVEPRAAVADRASAVEPRAASAGGRMRTRRPSIAQPAVRPQPDRLAGRARSRARARAPRACPACRRRAPARCPAG